TSPTPSPRRSSSPTRGRSTPPCPRRCTLWSTPDATATARARPIATPPAWRSGPRRRRPPVRTRGTPGCGSNRRGRATGPATADHPLASSGPSAPSRSPAGPAGSRWNFGDPCSPDPALRRVRAAAVVRVDAMDPAEAWVAVIIEDEPDVRMLLDTVLTQSGFRTVVATDGPEGIEAVRAHNPLLTTLDVNMPGMDGFAVAKRIREFSQTYLIMITGLGD